jgi:hypothetical protein
MAKCDFDIFSGPDFQMNPVEGTATSAWSWLPGQPFGFFPEGRLSPKCNGSRGKLLRTCEQKVIKEEKLTITFHRNSLIVLGKLPFEFAASFV